MLAVRLGLAAFVALPFAACSAVRVRPVDPRHYDERRHADVLNGPALSAATRESLRTLGLPERGCVANMCRLAAEEPGLSAERSLSSEAELWLAQGLASDRRGDAGREAAIAAYLESARAGYTYLFFTDRTPGERALEDRQRQVRDFYNYAAERVAVLLLEERRRRGDGATPEAIAVGGWTIEVGAADRLPGGAALSELVPASRLEFEGVRNAYLRDGFGAEFVAVVDLPAAATESLRESPYMATSLVLRFPGDTPEEVMAAKSATLEAYDSYRRESLEFHGTAVRLAANFTAPYLLWLERSRFARTAKHAFFSARSQDLARPQIHLLQPYDPERSVIVLIHGLGSSPEAWIDLANELMGDEEIRRHYQVWQVFYRSSAPISYNRAAIRDALYATLDAVDPERDDRARRQMVIVGHSMGGVIARLLVAEGGDEMWKALLGHAPSAEERGRLARLSPYLDLEPMPEVTRIVLLASPHRGAPLAGSWLGRFGARLVKPAVSVEQRAIEAAEALAADVPEMAARLRRSPDAIEALSDRLPYLKATSALPIASWVTYHSIIGCARPVATLAECGDGLVPYTSAHLDGAASELVVTSNHSVQGKPESILELRRILRQHLGTATN